jgi:hypothetical protein
MFSIFNDSDKANSFLVSSGSTSYNKGETNRIDRIIRHPLYVDTSEYDFAILILANKFKFSQYVQPARLPHAEFVIGIGDAVITMGWGITMVSRHTLSKCVQLKISQTLAKNWTRK